MQTKPIWQSKTFWVNLLALLGIQSAGLTTLISGLTPEDIAALLAAVNLLLRFVTTSSVRVALK